jgi:hypothetical protein
MQSNDVCLRLIQNARSPKVGVLQERRFIPLQGFESTASLPDKNSSPIGGF